MFLLILLIHKNCRTFQQSVNKFVLISVQINLFYNLLIWLTNYWLGQNIIQLKLFLFFFLTWEYFLMFNNHFNKIIFFFLTFSRMT